jgi:3'-5' exoribonuclease
LEKKQTNSTPAKDYFDILLCDSSGQLPAKYGDVTTNDKESFFPMGLVKVQGILHPSGQTSRAEAVTVLLKMLEQKSK